MRRGIHKTDSRRWRQRLALGLAALAVAVPAAPALGNIPPEPVRAAEGHPDESATHVRADVVVTTAARPDEGLGVATRPAPATTVDQPVTTRSTSSFDLADASIGLGIGLGASLTAALAVFLVQRRRGTLAGV